MKEMKTNEHSNTAEAEPTLYDYRYTISSKTTPEEINKLWDDHNPDYLSGWACHFHVNTEQDEDDYRERDGELIDDEWWHCMESGSTSPSSAAEQGALIAFFERFAHLFDFVEQVGDETGESSLDHEESAFCIRDGVLCGYTPSPPIVATTDGLTIRIPRNALDYVRSKLDRAGFVQDADGRCELMLLHVGDQRTGLEAEIREGRHDAVIHIRPKHR
ncbi:MAG: hypothetical protein AAFZ67_11410 [Planctomycetota bacterium]